MTCGAAGILRCGDYLTYHKSATHGRGPQENVLLGIEFSHVLIDEAGQVMSCLTPPFTLLYLIGTHSLPLVPSLDQPFISPSSIVFWNCHYCPTTRHENHYLLDHFGCCTILCSSAGQGYATEYSEDVEGSKLVVPPASLQPLFMHPDLNYACRRWFQRLCPHLPCCSRRLAKPCSAGTPSMPPVFFIGNPDCSIPTGKDAPAK
jgi:hypothetical protein